MPRLIKTGAVIACVVGLSWVVVPNLIVARNRSSQKRTMADMRSIAAAWEARATDVNSYSVRHSRLGRNPHPLGEETVTPAELAEALEPKYIRHLPRVDGWGSEFRFAVSDYDDAGEAATYTIRSLGRDRRRDASPRPAGPTGSFEADIVYSNGSFTQYPEEAG